MEEMITAGYDYILKYGIRILAALVIVVIGRWLARFIARRMEALMSYSHLDPMLASFFKDLIYFGLLIFVIVAAVSKLGVETTSIVAVVGAAGLAVGFALQGSLSNFASGVLLIILKPFRVGDVVECAGGVLGRVKEIKIFHMILRTPDNRKVVIPNSKIVNDNIINLSAMKERRVDLTFSISYSDDMKAAKEALMSVVTSHPKILKEPPPLVAVRELGESSVNIVCRPWVKPEDYWAVYSDVIEEGKLALERAGCVIPFPQRDVHVYQDGRSE